MRKPFGAQQARAALDRVASRLLDKETLGPRELLGLFADLEPESRSSDTVASAPTHTDPAR